MEKINTITVNGTTYEIGGNAQQDDNSYIIPLEFSKLASGDKDGIITAFGGQENFNNFVSTFQEKNIYIQLDNGCLTPAFAKLDGSYIRICWYGIKSTELKIAYVAHTSIFMLSSKPFIFSRYDDVLYIDDRIEVDIYDLNEESTSDTIKTALGGGDGFDGSGSGAAQFGAKQKKYTGLEGLNAICDLGVTFIKEESGDSIYKFSCNLPGCFGKEKGGIISIRYSSGTYSVDSILAF